MKFRSTFAAFHFSLIASSISSTAAQLSQCANHPATKDIEDFYPVLLQKWDEPSSDGGSTSRAGFAVQYLPRVSDIKYLPEDGTLRGRRNTAVQPDLSGGGLDLIVKNDEEDIMIHKDKNPTFTFHRPAKIYMMANANVKSSGGNDPSYPGWTSEGWYHNAGDSTEIKMGNHRHLTTVPLDKTVYVFSKITSRQLDGTNTIDLPSEEFVYRKSKNLVSTRERDNHVIWLVGEEDGLPSPVPKSIIAEDIEPGKTCPDALHDQWQVSVTNTKDPGFDSDVDIMGKSFATWHPIFDPCYWCSYDHEHGSDASTLVGPEFAPMYTYTAWKNGRQNESVPGFKSFVFAYRKYMVIYDVHIQTSQPRRFQTPIHSGTFSIVDVKTDPGNPQLLLKLTQKVDFGPLDFINEAGDVKPVNKTESTVFGEQNRRKFNRGRKVNNKMANEYESWDTKPMCAEDTSNGTLFRIRITNPPTAIDNFKGTDPSEFRAVPLSRELIRGIPSQQVGMRRQFIVKNVDIGVKHCAAEIANFTSARLESGVFYTDPMGKEAFSEPGPTRMWQYIHPDFNHLFFQDKLHLKMESAMETLYNTKDFNFPDNIPMLDALDPTVN